MKYLVVSTYPPMKCGIGKYAYQMVKNLRKSGNIVNVLSMQDGDGDFVENLNGWFNILKMLKYGFFYDKIVIQYQDSFFYSNQGMSKYLNNLATNFSFYTLFIVLGGKITTIIHEIPYPTNKLKKIFDYIKWSLCPKIVFHTTPEKENFEKFFFKLSSGKFELVEHNAAFYKFKDITKKQAREELRIPDNFIVFLCIGFIQYHKGFDRAIRAFERINNESMKLYVVGSVRLAEYTSYLDDLKEMAAYTPNVFVIDQYVSDELFDTWLIACDSVIVPYREIWSSSVVARAKLFKKLVIASNVGGLKDQLGENDIIFNNDEDLRFIIQEFSELIRKNGKGVESEV